MSGLAVDNSDVFETQELTQASKKSVEKNTKAEAREVREPVQNSKKPEEKAKTVEGLEPLSTRHQQKKGGFTLPVVAPRDVIIPPPRYRRREVQGKPDRVPLRSLKRLARRGGVKRISKTAVQSAKEYVQDFIQKTVEYALVFLDSRKRTICSSGDVRQAFRHMNCPFFGNTEHGATAKHL